MIITSIFMAFVPSKNLLTISIRVRLSKVSVLDLCGKKGFMKVKNKKEA